MTRTAMISAIALTFAAPAFAADNSDLVNLGKTSPAEIVDTHNDSTDFMTENDLGATSPAVIDQEGGDILSTMSASERDELEDLGVTSPAERAD
ncbi:MAG: hypothetical protein AAFQ47_15405 [Pseudomonadota bacterium]